MKIKLKTDKPTIKQLGEKKYEALKMRANQVSKIDLQVVKIYLEQENNRMCIK